MKHWNGMRPVHPGEILLQDYLRPSGTSVREAAKALDVSYEQLLEITTGERAVTSEVAERLERQFGSEAKGWLNLQAAYEHRVAEVTNTSGPQSQFPMRPPTWDGLEKEARRRFRARLDAADMISVDEAARILDVNSQVIDDLVRTRCLLGVRAPGEAWRIPAWQIVEPLRSELPAILDALDLDAWGALAWLETALGGLDGRTPRTAVEQGQGTRVVMLARAEGT